MILEQIFGAVARQNTRSVNLINEADWSDRSPLLGALASSRGRWVHFSEIPKIGVHPRSMWTMTGPYGVYLYPVNFLLSGNERTLEGQQFGTNLPYYFLCDLNTSLPGINLSKMTDVEASRIAAANGFSEALDVMTEKLGSGNAGVTFWKCLRNMNDGKLMSWNKALKGLSYVIDESGIMYGHLEPFQAVVLNPKVLQHVSMHNNLDASFKKTNSERSEDKFDTWKKVYLDVLGGLREEFGGDIRWKEDRDLDSHDKKKAKVRHRSVALPELRFEKDGKSFKIHPVLGRSRHGFSLEFTFGRETDHRIIDAQDMRKMSTQELKNKLSGFVHEVMGYESDLRFTPIVSEDVAHTIMNDGIASPGDPLQIEVEVGNHERYNSVRYSGERSSNVDDIALNIKVRLKLSEKSMTSGLRIDVAGQAFVDITQYGEYTEDQPMIAELLDEVEKSIRERHRLYGPAATWKEPYNFRSDEMWNAYLGWLALHIGLSFDGDFKDRFAEEIAVYQDYEHKDDLAYRIGLILGRR